MSKKRKRRGLVGVGAFLGILVEMAELVGGSALPTDLVSLIESGKTVWVGGFAGLPLGVLADLQSIGEWMGRSAGLEILRQRIAPRV